MPILTTMRKGKPRRVGEAARGSVYDLSNQRQGTYRSGSHPWNEQQLGKVGWAAIGCGGQVRVQAPHQNVAWADLVVVWHDQMRQHGLLWIRHSRPVSPSLQGHDLARNPVRPPGVQNLELNTAGQVRTVVGEIDDLALPRSLNGGVRLVNKALQPFGQPMIAASLPALAVHALLNDHPLAGIGHHEPVQIEIEAVLHGGAVHLGNEPARRGERGSIEPDAISDRDQLVRGLAGVSSRGRRRRGSRARPQGA